MEDKATAKKKSICDVTDYEIKQIVDDMFKTEKITCIRRHKRDDYVTCNIYYKWTCQDDGHDDSTISCDEIELRDPDIAGWEAVYSSGYPTDSSDVDLLQQFCIAKGIIPEWLRNNPYLKEASNGFGVPEATWQVRHPSPLECIYTCSHCGAHMAGAKECQKHGNS